jgi:hypothetical protein
VAATVAPQRRPAAARGCGSCRTGSRCVGIIVDLAEERVGDRSLEQLPLGQDRLVVERALRVSRCDHGLFSRPDDRTDERRRDAEAAAHRGLDLTPQLPEPRSFRLQPRSIFPPPSAIAVFPEFAPWNIAFSSDLSRANSSSVERQSLSAT